VVEVGSEFGIVIAVGERDPDLVILFCIRQQVISVLTEMPGTHAQTSLHDH